MIDIRRYRTEDAGAFLEAARESHKAAVPLRIHGQPHDAIVYALLGSSWRDT